MQKHPQVSQWPSRDYRTYKSLSAQTKVKYPPNPTGSSRPRATWKYKHMLKRMTVPGESIPKEESEDIDNTDTDSMGGISESSPVILLTDSGILSHAIMSTDSGILSPGMMSSDSGIMSPGPSPARTRSYGEFKTEKFRGSFYKG